MGEALAAAVPHHRVIAPAGSSRPWLVLVHGASQHSGLFSAQLAAFGERCRLLLVDLPGHGGSAALPGPFGLVEYASAVRLALDDAGIGEAHYWGTHTGAGVGLLLALSDPARFRSLILEGAVLPGRDMPYVTATVARARETARLKGLAAARAEWFDEAGWFEVIRRHPDTCRAAEHRSMIDAFGGAPWTDATPPSPVAPVARHLSSLDTPTLLMNGEFELADFVSVADELSDRMPGARREVIAGAGGFPLWEYPARTNALVAHFLDSLG